MTLGARVAVHLPPEWHESLVEFLADVRTPFGVIDELTSYGVPVEVSYRAVAEAYQNAAISDNEYRSLLGELRLRRY
jgi:hypothetical protein